MDEEKVEEKVVEEAAADPKPEQTAPEVDTTDYKKLYEDLQKNYSDISDKYEKLTSEYKSRFSGTAPQLSEDASEGMAQAERIASGAETSYEDLFASAAGDVEKALEGVPKGIAGAAKSGALGITSDKDKVLSSDSNTVASKIGPALSGDMTALGKSEDNRYDIREQGFTGALKNWAGDVKENFEDLFK